MIQFIIEYKLRVLLRVTTSCVIPGRDINGWLMLRNSNWTEWGTIQGVIAQVISKSDEREARGRFEITSPITP